ncbi:sigma-70 family RNA polymerase sigma factor [Schumannella luteola]|uniref:RNA polymerase sigma factor (Sigma-70 family) n=1 Tax=Schumannella luteola TaxID=472059 RepID=A0A852YHE2_9MICO|nr:RNA polymerase sigma factor [Schumannella luteola]NYG99267.1 RNA polymerase sigma factor (sigma-70 family) [Schumannella luteola]TPW93563.1 RNA polymerase sigma factor [Schumannella luteola]
MTTEPFEAIVQRHGATVLRLCRALVGADDADDAWSETFLSALRGYDDLPADANVEAWLVTISHRRSVDLIRARARRAVPAEEIAERPAPPQRGPLGDLDLLRAVAALPDRQRQAVAYHHLVGLPHEEVARAIGGTSAAARKAASDGVKALRERLGGAADESTPLTGTNGETR